MTRGFAQKTWALNLHISGLEFGDRNNLQWKMSETHPRTDDIRHCSFIKTTITMFPAQLLSLEVVDQWFRILI